MRRANVTTGGTMVTSLECCVCSQIEGRPANDLIARMLPDQAYARRVMLESPSFAVIPSLGPLTSGHSLLCPKPHLKSFAELDGGLHAEYRQMKSTLRSALSGKYSAEVCLFEHGMARHGNRVLCTVDHAHLHFVPLPCGFDGALTADPGWIEFDGSIDMLRHLSAGEEYVYVETPDGVSRLLTSDHGPFASQHMRKSIAERLGRGACWNWREAPDPQAADEAWRRFVFA
jgi:ATP adenylyltransferase